MNFDWRIAIFVTQFLSIIVTLTAFCVIKFNDVVHISKDVKEIKNSIKEINTNVDKISKAQVKRDALCEERHPKK